MAIGIILAAGIGQRMESHSIPKAYIEVGNQPLFMYSLNQFNKNTNIDRIILVVNKNYYEYALNYVKPITKVEVIIGGKTRQESVFLALNYLKNNNVNDEEIVLIHDSARPLVSQKIIDENILSCLKFDACLTSIKCIDTILTRKEDILDQVLNRQALLNEQTPAAFKFHIIYDCHKKAIKDNIFDASDDVQLVKKCGYNIHIVEGSRYNFKITNELDLALFKYLLDNNNFNY